jgi:hypothetical protein
VKLAPFLTFLAVFAVPSGAQEAGLALPSGPVGPAGLDLNPATGDQGQRQTYAVPAVGDAVSVDVIAATGVRDRIGFEVALAYDPAQLAVVEANPAHLFAAATPVTTVEGGLLTMAGVLLAGPVAYESGTIATVRFRVLGGFTGQTAVTLRSALVGTAAAVDSLLVGPGARFVVVGGAPPDFGAPTPDFNRSGTVDFADFVAFAQAFGLREGDQSFNPSFDLDGSKDVGFGDFILFARAFGT